MPIWGLMWEFKGKLISAVSFLDDFRAKSFIKREVALLQIDHTLYLQFPFIVIFEMLPETAIPDIPGAISKKPPLFLNVFLRFPFFVIDILIFL